ncbi:MAG: chaperone modulator CbpM [Nitrosospira sp.]
MISRDTWIKGNETPQVPGEIPAEMPEEVPDEAPNEIPDEAPGEAPDNKPDEMPDETPDELPPETPDETPARASGILLDEHGSLTLAEISSACAVEAGYIVELVDEGLITPEIAPGSQEPRKPQSWRFSGMHLRHVRIASHLQGDLGVNLSGAALAMQLLDEVEALRRRLNAMGQREQ